MPRTRLHANGELPTKKIYVSRCLDIKSVLHVAGRCRVTVADQLESSNCITYGESCGTNTLTNHLYVSHAHPPHDCVSGGRSPSSTPSIVLPPIGGPCAVIRNYTKGPYHNRLESAR